jgi:hypothetical protein
MHVEMDCRNKPFKGAECALLLEDGHAELTTEGDEVVFSGTYQELDAAARFPSFAESIKYFGVLHEGRILDFEVDKADIKAIRRELDGQAAADDPAAIDRMARKGKLLTLGGIAAIVAGPVLTLVSYQAVPEEGGKYYIWYGISIFGAFILAQGISLLRRAGRAKRDPQQD